MTGILSHLLPVLLWTTPASEPARFDLAALTDHATVQDTVRKKAPPPKKRTDSASRGRKPGAGEPRLERRKPGPRVNPKPAKPEKDRPPARDRRRPQRRSGPPG
jgi:hypothetical protein